MEGMYMVFCLPASILITRRRTGVTLDQRPLDLNGIEEITGIFSSPRKPSPLKQMILMQSIESSSMMPNQASKTVAKPRDRFC